MKNAFILVIFMFALLFPVALLMAIGKVSLFGGFVYSEIVAVLTFKADKRLSKQIA